MRRVGAVMIALVMVACGDSTSPGSLPEATFFSYVSSPGEYVGAGESHRYVLADGRWRATYASAGGYEAIRVYADGLPAGAWWSLEFVSPEGQRLLGTHDVARRSAGPNQSGLDVYGNSRGCNTVTGQFVIRSIVLGAENTVDRFWATFDQHCEGTSPVLRGEIAIVANPWR